MQEFLTRIDKFLSAFTVLANNAGHISSSIDNVYKSFHNHEYQQHSVITIIDAGLRIAKAGNNIATAIDRLAAAHERLASK